MGSGIPSLWPRRRAAPMDTLKQSTFLTFMAPGIEDEYQAFVHRRPRVIMAVAFFASIFNGILAGLTFTGLDRIIVLMYSVVSFFVTVVLFTSLAKHRKLPEEQRGIQLWLKAERVALAIGAFFLAIVAVAVSLLNMLDCKELPGVALDDTAAFRRPATCSRWYTFFAFSHHVAIIMGRVVPVKLVSISCASVTAFIIIFGLAIGVPEPIYQVWLFAVWHAAASAFLCLAAYQYERTSRNNFRSVKALHALSVKLQEQQKRNREQLHSLLPTAVLRKAVRNTKGSVLDTTADGIVLAACIHDFPGWCVRNLPIQVSLLQSLFRDEVEKSSMCPLGSLGDTVVAAGNLLSPIAQPAAEAMKAAKAVMHVLASQESLPPQCLVMQIGPLIGGFVAAGHLGLRYAVYGQAFDEALSAVAACGPNEALCCAAAEVVASTPLCKLPIVDEFPKFYRVPFTKLALWRLEGDNSYSEPSEGPGSYSGVAEIEENILEQQLNRSVVYVDNIEANQTAEAELRERVAKATATKKVWCIFTVFADPQMEDEFVQRRTKMLPTAASVTWLGYAGFTAVLFVLGVVELGSSQYNLAGMLLLLASIAIAVGMAAVPHVLCQDTMRRVFFVWSVAGVLQPLMVVYGAALSRPAAIGNDVRGYMLAGAMVRAYCFSSTRWMAIIAPMATIMGLFQYQLPGAVIRGTTVGLWVYILFIVFGEWYRERDERAGFCRVQERKLIVFQQRRAKIVEEGLLAAAIPRRCYEAIVELRSRGYDVESNAVAADGVAVLVNARSRVQPPANENKLTHAAISRQFDPLEKFVNSCNHLSVASILGDRALVVGPAFASLRDAAALMARESSEAVAEAAALCRTLDSDSEGFGCLLDTDPIIHAVANRNGTVVYRALGVATTRLLSIGIGLDAKQFRGTLVSERIARIADGYVDLKMAQRETVGPMKIRGVGLVRLLRLLWDRESTTTSVAGTPTHSANTTAASTTSIPTHFDLGGDDRLLS